MIKSSAPGKIILLGEHAVVYSRPAIAVPVTCVQATASAEAAPPGSGCTLHAADLGRTIRLATAASDDPLAAAVRGVLTLPQVCNLREGEQATEPDVTLSIHSTIPLAGGMGSGAAVSAALVRALAMHLGCPLDDATVSALVFEVEKLHHGTPSGIDNTVVVYARPVYFVRGQPAQTFHAAKPFHIVIGDTGLASPTRIAVGDVRAAWQADPPRYEAIFHHIGQLAQAARLAIEGGQLDRLGALMNDNHALLQELGVSCAELDTLVDAARQAGALGAKLSGGGRGGNMIALVTPKSKQKVEQALAQAGARNVIATEIKSRVLVYH